MSPKEEDKRLVFQCLDMNRPSQIVVRQKPANPLQGTPPEGHTIQINQANQFVVPADAEPYDEIVGNLRKALTKKGVNFAEKGVGPNGATIKENILPADQKPKTPEQKLAEAQLAIAEKSDLITQINKANENLQKEIERLKKLAEGKGAK
jgi:hypothetical protein